MAIRQRKQTSTAGVRGWFRRRRSLVVIGMAAVLVLAAALLTLQLPSNMERRIADLRSEGAWEAALQLQGRLVAVFPRSDAARISVMNSRNVLSVGGPDVLVGAEYVLTSGAPRPEGAAGFAERILDHLDRIAPRQAMEMWEYNLLEDKAELLAELERYDQARATMETAIAGFEAERSFSRALSAHATMLSWISDDLERLQATQSVLSKPYARMSQHPGTVGELQVILGDAARELGRHDLARSAYTAALEAEELGMARAEEHSREQVDVDAAAPVRTEQPTYRRAQFGLRAVEFAQSAREPAAVTGTITVQGSAEAGIRVYLTPAGDSRGYSSRRILEESFSGRTDSQGRFHIGGVVPGRYAVTIGLSGELAADIGRRDLPAEVSLGNEERLRLDLAFSRRIGFREPKGRVELPADRRIRVPIAWSPLPSAHSYRVELLILRRGADGKVTGWRSVPYVDGVEGSSYTLRVDGVARWAPAPISFRSGELDPGAVLGPWYPGALVGLRVVAYDEEGEMLSDTEGLVFNRNAAYPLLVVGDYRDSLPRPLRAALDATIEGDYPEALPRWEEVEQALEGNEMSITEETRGDYLLLANLALARLYARLPDPFGDPAQARGYYRRLAELAAEQDQVLPDPIERELRGYLQM